MWRSFVVIVRPLPVTVLVLAAYLLASCSSGPKLENAEVVCPMFTMVREVRGDDSIDRDTTQKALVMELLAVMPEEYHDEIALWHYPIGGPVDGLDTSGTNATRAGEVLDGLYRASC